jgi:hypothetical protein
MAYVMPKGALGIGIIDDTHHYDSGGAVNDDTLIHQDTHPHVTLTLEDDVM